MSDVKQELQGALSRFIGERQTLTVFTAKVTNIYMNTQTVDVEAADGMELYGVRLKAAVDELEKGLVVFPKRFSQVLVANIGNSPNEFTVIHVAEVDKAILWTSAAEVIADATGVSVEVGSMFLKLDSAGLLVKKTESLQDVVGDLIEQIKLITVTCAAPGSPSTVPLNFAAFDAIKLRMQQLLKDG